MMAKAEAGCAATSQGLPAALEGGRAQGGPPGHPACALISDLWPTELCENKCSFL